MRTLRLKMVLTEQQKGSLLRTMEAYTRAFEIAARWGYENHECRKLPVQYAIYYHIRAAVPELGASLVQSAKDTACEALKRAKLRHVPTRRTYAAVRFPWKDAKVYFESGRLSIYSVDGRVHARVLLYDHIRRYLGWNIKISNLSWDRASREFYLGVVIEKKCSARARPGPVLGIDRGLRNVAVCSNNMFFNAARIKATRGRYAKNKAELQAKGTRSAKRRLRRQAGRERRFVTCENHRISKTIVNTDFEVFALEDLRGIACGNKLNKKMRTMVSGWAFHQLQEFIIYKAEEAGKAVVLVDPTCTSQWCSRCGWIDPKNRNGHRFHCAKCGYELDADLNASRNIARLGMTEAGRLMTSQPHATDDEAGHSGVLAQGRVQLRV